MKLKVPLSLIMIHFLKNHKRNSSSQYKGNQYNKKRRLNKVKISTFDLTLLTLIKMALNMKESITPEL